MTPPTAPQASPMTVTRVLVANRGEIAIRVMRAVSDMGLKSVAVFPEDDSNSLHIRKADASHLLEGSGPAAYLDVDAIIRAAQDNECDAVHPGYGFLAESPELARRCAQEGLTFIGPAAAVLDLFGSKVEARRLAERIAVPVVPGAGSSTGITVEEARSFFDSLPIGRSMILKAVAGGGGRGQRLVFNADDVTGAFHRCASEALASFGDDRLFAEMIIDSARHIEVQVIGDGTSASHVWDRDCTAQRRRQKLVEIAPAPGLDPQIREALLADAVRLASEVRYRGLLTCEFLVDAHGYYFMEGNPRLQVEHTVTEMVTGTDLVQAQLAISAGGSLCDVGMSQESIPCPDGFAIQCRINMETMFPDGVVHPSTGTISAFDLAAGPGVRVDSSGYVGFVPNPRYDSLIAKVVTHSPRAALSQALNKAERALAETRIEGVATNVHVLRSILHSPELRDNRLTTTFVDEHVAELVASAGTSDRHLYFRGDEVGARAGAHKGGDSWDARSPSRTDELLCRLDGVSQSDLVHIRAPMVGTVVQVDVAEGEAVAAGTQLLVLEAMKMEHVISATAGGRVAAIVDTPGEVVQVDQLLAVIDGKGEVSDIDVAADATQQDSTEVGLRLAEVLDRRALTGDGARDSQVMRRRRTEQRTARENVADLCDVGSFNEYGGLALAPGTGLSAAESTRRYPGDGLIAGVGDINGHLFPDGKTRAVVMSYDYTVMAGTQGPISHRKTTRMLELALKWRLPVVAFTEGGGGRAGTGGGENDTQSDEDRLTQSTSRPGMTHTWAALGRLKGVAPTVAINSGRCFAGNAAILGACDVVIATMNSNIGMGGPAMIEGGGLGSFAPEEIGPIDVQVASGVVDIAVADEAEGVSVAKQYLSYFQGTIAHWTCSDQRQLRAIVPENRVRSYDMRAVIDGLADDDSVLELRSGFGKGMITALGRIEGRPVGILANNPMHLAGAIDSDGADKAARFQQLCDTYGLPLVVLIDTPGIMVGPDVERTALVRHCNRLFITGANLHIPLFTVVVRKSMGLGAAAMAAGSMSEPFFTVAWPAAEFATMGLEGQVRLGYRAELATIANPAAREARFRELVDLAHENSKALKQAEVFGVDDVIDPGDTRAWLVNGLRSAKVADGALDQPRLDVW